MNEITPMNAFEARIRETVLKYMTFDQGIITDLDLLISELSGIIGPPAPGHTVWFQHEVYFSGIRFDAGEYRLVRIGDHQTDPDF